MDRRTTNRGPFTTAGALGAAIDTRMSWSPVVVRWYDEGRPTDHVVVGIDVDPTGTAALVIDRGDEDTAGTPGPADVRVWVVVRDLDMPEGPEVDLFYTEEGAREHAARLVDRGEHAENVLVREERIAEASWIGERQ